MIQVISEGLAVGAVITGTVHVLKPSSSSYGLSVGGKRLQYCCQDGCCDAGLRPDVAAVVRKAKQEYGATKVVIRTGQRQFYRREIAGLPVEDVSDHVGPIDEAIFIDRRY